MAKETWIQGQCQEVEACLRKNNSKKAYQLVKVLTTEKQGKSTTMAYKTSLGSVSQRRIKSLTGGHSTAQTLDLCKSPTYIYIFFYSFFPYLTVMLKIYNYSFLLWSEIILLLSERHKAY